MRKAFGYPEQSQNYFQKQTFEQPTKLFQWKETHLYKFGCNPISFTIKYDQKAVKKTYKKWVKIERRLFLVLKSHQVLVFMCLKRSDEQNKDLTKI